MRVGILGRLEVTADGTSVEVGGIRLRALLIRLALDAGHVVTVESLSHTLWPDGGPADPANALQSLVSRLRRVIPDQSVLRSVAGGYCLDLPPDDVDALRFERLVRSGRSALIDGHAQPAARQLREALALWRGAALADVADAPFAVAAAARLEELRLTATEDRIEAEIPGATDHSYVVAELEELTAAYPLRERLRDLQLKALHASGRRAEALTAYERFRTLLADELGSDPGPALRETHLDVLRGAEPPHRPSGERPSGNLRAALTSFVGRPEELARIRSQLATGRLVTLVGPGGAGKTRLATATGAALADTIGGGVWLAELASVTDPADLPYTMIGALGLRERSLIDAGAGPRDPVDRLAEALSANDMLVILDNCEHLLDAAAHLAHELLGRCPRLRVLATSREPLGVIGESLCPVPPLGLPESGASATVAMGSSAVRLFADRVNAVRPGFRVTDQNVASVVEICRRLDGLPLAIELAAARLRSLPVEQLATRLDDRFRLLTGGSRTAVPRHRTLRAVVAWSWDLLTEDERRMVMWLAAFSGTITPEAAAQLVAVNETVPSAVLDVLSALVDKSLLQCLEGDEPRYRMLETIREYGLERLAETGDVAKVRGEHAAYFLRLAEMAEPELRGPDQVSWLVRLAAEHENLLAALHFAVDAADADTAVRLAASLGLFWTIRGDHAEATEWLRLAVELTGDAPSGIRTRATVWYLLNRVLSGGYVRSDVAVEELRTQFTRGDADAGHPVSALLEPVLALIADDVVEGPAMIDRQLSHPDSWTRAMLRLMRAFLQANHGNIGGARDDLLAAVDGFRTLGERWGWAMSLTWLAHAHTTLGDVSGAVRALEESIRLMRELDADDDAVLQRVWLAVTRAQQGEVERARAELLEMVAGGMGASSARYLVFARHYLGELARHAGDLEEATRQYDIAWNDLVRVPFYAPPFRAMLSCARGHLAMASADLATAERHLREALPLAVGAADTPVVAVVTVGVAWLSWHRADTPMSARLLGAAHALRGGPDATNPDVAGLARQLRDTLGESAYDLAYAAGRVLERRDALTLIASQLERDVAAF
ncbi:BTAD domain-containing putative transcriptional regulator [Micromonospora luteifusca]|uniref:BTAD domain-containing putative transcriptional regulator n=1 Tax=Micromonospora luteifusca TaxID=709860 RepID=UPI0033B80358